MIPAVSLPDGRKVPALGQGTWNLGTSRSDVAAEVRVLREGIDLGMSLLDTAEIYADGGAERVVAQAIAGQRDKVFLVSKVAPSHASATAVVKHCDASLQRLGTAMIDLFLLHWPGRHPLADTVAAFERLRASGKIRYWGVSNFDTDEMETLLTLPRGANCATDQVLYNPQERGPEFDLLPWCAKHRMPVMAYSPLGQAGNMLKSAALSSVAIRHDASPAQIAIAWSLRSGGVISIPKASSLAHIRENAAAAAIKLTAEDLRTIDKAHKPPAQKQPLGII